MSCPNCACPQCSVAPRPLYRRVLDLLDNGKDHTIAALREELGCDPRHLNNELCKLVAYELIDRVGRGVYRKAGP